MQPDTDVPRADRGRTTVRWVLAAIVTSTWAVALLEALNGFGDGARHPALGVTVVVVVGLLHVRHAHAAANGRQPGSWPLTLALMVFLVVVLPHLYPMSVNNAAFFVGGSAAMLLPRRYLAVWIALPTLWFVFVPVALGDLNGTNTGFVVWYLWYAFTVLSLGMLGLYSTSRLAFVLDQFRRTRSEMQAVTAVTERLRLSRDLHDVLGASLTAIALKAEVASRLHPTDPAGGAQQVRELTELAEQTRADLRTVTQDRRTMNFEDELAGALRLLRLAGVDATAAVVQAAAGTPLDALWAWAVREGTANVLRHSNATRCLISLDVGRSATRFVMTNDHPEPSDEPTGNGLAGLTERAHALNGMLEAIISGNGWFRLEIEVPAAIDAAMAEVPT
jgi:two-component system, NarL family, sensor histidine kinase DesK